MAHPTTGAFGSANPSAATASAASSSHASTVFSGAPTDSSSAPSETNSESGSSQSSGSSGSSSGISVGEIAGIAIGGAALVVLSVASFLWICLRRHRDHKNHPEHPKSNAPATEVMEWSFPAPMVAGEVSGGKHDVKTSQFPAGNSDLRMAGGHMPNGSSGFVPTNLRSSVQEVELSGYSSTGTRPEME